MKWLKRIGIAILFLPFLLILSIIVYEVWGMCANHAAADRQTKKLQRDLENRIADIKILNVQSETGNLSGTGNHVECLSMIAFTSEMTEDEIVRAMAEYFESAYAGCFLERREDGSYLMHLETAAPFPDNIEGH